MSDSELRALERLVQQGDEEAAEKLFHQRLRSDGGESATAALAAALVHLRRFIEAVAARDPHRSPAAALNDPVTWADRCGALSYITALDIPLPWPPLADPITTEMPVSFDSMSTVVGAAKPLNFDGFDIMDEGYRLTIRPRDLNEEVPCSHPTCRGQAATDRCGGFNWTFTKGCGHQFCTEHLTWDTTHTQSVEYCPSCTAIREEIQRSGGSLY